MTLFLGVILLIGGFGTKFYLEKDYYEGFLSRQDINLKKTWNVEWKKYLSELIESGELKEGYRLTWNIKSERIDEKFYPVKSKKINWKKFEFTQENIKNLSGWNRAIALKEYVERNPKEEVKFNLTKYEMTIVDWKANYAFNKIISQLDLKPQIPLDGKFYDRKDVFFTRLNENQVLGFIPDVQIIKERYLDIFRKRIGVDIDLWKVNSLNLKFKSKPWYFNIDLSIQVIYFVLTIFLILISVLFYLLDLRRNKKLVLKKVSFLNQVVHEVKTPLTAIKLNAQLLENSEDKVVGEIINNVNRLNSLFDDIVLINNNDYRANIESVSFINLEKKLREFDVDDLSINTLEGTILTDLKVVNVIVRNLIKNAKKYGKKAFLSVDVTKNDVLIQVRDVGEGISHQEASKIFEKFYRSERAKNINPDGLGIGLSICKELAQKINAKLLLINPGEKGAIFELRLKR